ncbi:MAG: HD-GYP domain-containing protein [Chloroflexota bacterium]
MLKQLSETQSLQRQFQDANSMLMSIVRKLTLTGSPIVSTAIQDITRLSESLQRMELEVGGQLKGGRSQLTALMGIGSVINSSLGKKRVLEEVMDSLIALMGAERGFLMLRDSNGELRPEIARGIEHIDLVEQAFAFSQTIVHKVAETGQPLLTTNAQEDPNFKDQRSVAAYQLRSIICAPLKIRDQLIGVIYVDHRVKADIFRKGDLEVIKAFANQAAVAIDNAELFDKLQKSNRDLDESNRKLEKAYQKTLEGWVHALDLKDKETEGHTMRVTILTERLARFMGVEGDALEHIRRGALLHDIGKMGIPDSILLKRGTLTEDERAIIQQHPIYAYEMLNPIKFLEPAMDIPYCHHEKWDGTGYPRRLRGMEIPFAARVFSVVDVWDALVSDRPYRKALPPGEVRQYIQVDSGKHFDPHVVRAFMEMGNFRVDDTIPL